MKQSILYVVLLSAISMTANANETDTDHLMFPEDIEVAEASNEQLNAVPVLDEANRYVVADNNRRSTAQRNMKSRRYLMNTNKNKGDAYAYDSEWVGATKVEDNQMKNGVAKRLNQQFMSRRAFRPHR